MVLDVGECLVDETRRYAAWADRPGFRIGGLLELSGLILNANANANADAGTGEGDGEA
ncbi:hypothetical protein GCM10010295_37340 [Streptomyces intermedius]